MVPMLSVCLIHAFFREDLERIEERHVRPLLVDRERQLGTAENDALGTAGLQPEHNGLEFQQLFITVDPAHDGLDHLIHEHLPRCIRHERLDSPLATSGFIELCLHGRHRRAEADCPDAIPLHGIRRALRDVENGNFDGIAECGIQAVDRIAGNDNEGGARLLQKLYTGHQLPLDQSQILHAADLETLEGQTIEDDRGVFVVLHRAVGATRNPQEPTKKVGRSIRPHAAEDADGGKSGNHGNEKRTLRGSSQRSEHRTRQMSLPLRGATMSGAGDEGCHLNQRIASWMAMSRSVDQIETASQRAN